MVVTVKGGEISDKERDAYVAYVQEKYGRRLESLEIELDGDDVNLSYQLSDVPFERIRRITGYLVGTLDRWNNAKKAEEADRVKHGVCVG
jgi:hypothetical protein